MYRHSQIIVHIGYPKAASTTLQLHLFSKHSEINYLGHHGSNFEDLDYSRLHYFYRLLISSGAILSSDDFFVRPLQHSKSLYEEALSYSFQNEATHLEKLYCFYKNYIINLLYQDRVNLFSSETLTEFPLDPTICCNFLKADRINEIFPSAKIIIIIREQKQAIRSYYDWIKKGKYKDGKLTFSQLTRKGSNFGEWLSQHIEHSSPLLKQYEYNELVKYYIQLFGIDNVGVFCLEDLQTNPEEFANQISNFIGINDEKTKSLLNNHKQLNQSKTSVYRLLYYKLRQKIFKGYALSRFVPNKNLISVFNGILNNSEKKLENTYLNPEDIEKIDALYANSNAELQKVTGLNLESRGYPT